MEGNGTERALGRLEEGLIRVTEQGKEIRVDMMEMMSGLTVVTQEVRFLKERMDEGKNIAKDNKSNLFAIGALIVSALGLLAQVFIK